MAMTATIVHQPARKASIRLPVGVSPMMAAMSATPRADVASRAVL